MATGSTDKVRIALVGCGRIMPAHLWGYKRLKEAGYERFEITALVARRIEDALRFRKRGEGPGPREQAMPPGDPLAAPHIYLDEFQPDVEVNVYTDYREMLKEERVDAVDIYASLFVHHEIAIAALEAGKHVMVEKPMGITVRACRRMCDAAERAGKVLAVAENARYGQATRMRRWAIEQGLIGKVQMLLHGGIGGFWSPDGIIADTPWRHKKVLGGGGPTIDLGVHFFDVYRYIIGEVDEVYASVRTFEPKRYRRDELGRVLDEVDVDVDDTFFAIVHFKDGAIGQITFSWAGRG
ncbi:MAG TPA: Gfo/Idh/MocA family oxidoreductase, partial [Armatimonadetes bacterium]|nr:Gfo/Idh/MocA family oxidoreductase [Armatimonadota bacterium]